MTRLRSARSAVELHRRGFDAVMFAVFDPDNDVTEGGLHDALRLFRFRWDVEHKTAVLGFGGSGLYF